MSVRIAVLVGPPPWPARTQYFLKQLEAQFALDALVLVEEPKRRVIRQAFRKRGPLRGALRLLATALIRPLNRRIRARQEAHFAALTQGFNARTPQIALGPLYGQRALAWLNEQRPDVIIPIAGEVIRPQLLALCRWVRWHHGITPFIRGLAAPFWAVFHNRPDWLGVTVQELVEKIDAGPILAQRLLPPAAAADLPDCQVKLDELCIELLIEALRGLASGTLRPRMPDLAQGRYFSAPGPLDVMRFGGRERRFFQRAARE